LLMQGMYTRSRFNQAITPASSLIHET
jgi:hypothetical protein